MSRSSHACPPSLWAGHPAAPWPVPPLPATKAAQAPGRAGTRSVGPPVLETARRSHILNHIEHIPGLHLRALQRSIAIPLDTLDYHLRVLERKGRVVIRTFDRYKAYYPSVGMDRRDRDMLYYLRHELPLRIIIQILIAPGPSHTELIWSLKIASSTCEHHLKRLLLADIVYSVPDGRNKRLYLQDPGRVFDLVGRYADSFSPDIVRAVRSAGPIPTHTGAPTTGLVQRSWAVVDQERPVPDPS